MFNYDKHIYLFKKIMPLDSKISLGSEDIQKS